MTQEKIHTELPIIVKKSPFCMPDKINIAPEIQNPIKAKSSNFQSLFFFVLFEVLSSNFSLTLAI